MSPEPARPRTITPHDVTALHAAGEAIVMVTAYTAPQARAADAAAVDVVLVGDSAATTVLGLDSTVPVEVDELLVLCRAVRRGLRRALLLADLPFGSYEVSDEQAVGTAIRFVKEGGADAVKLEGGGTSADRVAAIVAAGIPVVGHAGLTPQTAAALGGLRAQGRTAPAARGILEDCLRLQDAGAFAVVLEAVPSAVTEHVVEHLTIPTVGIGAGPATAGQVLVLHDLLGIGDGHVARFVRRFADVGQAMEDGLRAYADAVRGRSFPGPEHGYTIPDAELAELRDQGTSPRSHPAA